MRRIFITYELLKWKPKANNVKIVERRAKYLSKERIMTRKT